MRTLFAKAILALVVLTSAALYAGDSSAQTFGVTTTPSNGPAYVRAITDIVGMDSTWTGWRVLNVSNNMSGIPVIATTGTDSFPGTGTRHFSDSLAVVVTHPITLFVHQDVSARDTSGGIHVALTVPYTPVVIAPNVISPRDSLFRPIVGSTTAVIDGYYNTGFEGKAYIKIIMCYGDSNFVLPMWLSPLMDSTYYVVGDPNQWVHKPITLNLGSYNYLFSYKIIFVNSFGSDTSIKYGGKTLPGPAPSMVTTPYSVIDSFHSVTFNANVSSNTLATTVVAHCRDTLGNHDSLTVTIPAGMGNVIEHFNFPGRVAGTYNRIWCTSQNSMNLTAYVSGSILTSTLALPDTFTVVIDSYYVSGMDQETIVMHTNVPAGSACTNLTYVSAPYPAMWPHYDDSLLGTAYGGTTHYTLRMNGLVHGANYAFYFVGNDLGFTRMYTPGMAQRNFTFLVPAPIFTFGSALSTVSYMGSTSLNWSTTYATSVTINGSAVALSGPMPIGPLTTTTTYTIIVNGPGGSDTSSVTVTVVPPSAPTASMVTTTGATHYALGDTASLLLSVTGIVSHAWLNGSPASVTGGVIYITTPMMGTTNFVFAIDGPGGVDTAWLTIFIDTPIVLKVDDFILNSFRVFPNPANNMLIVSTQYPLGVEYGIANVLGQAVVEPKKATSEETTIDVSSIPPGMYELIIKKNGERIKQNKFIKQ